MKQVLLFFRKTADREDRLPDLLFSTLSTLGVSSGRRDPVSKAEYAPALSAPVLIEIHIPPAVSAGACT